jgi:hypothetical protein
MSFSSPVSINSFFGPGNYPDSPDLPGSGSGPLGPGTSFPTTSTSDPTPTVRGGTPQNQQSIWQAIASIPQGIANIIYATRVPTAPVMNPASIYNPIGASAPPITAAGSLSKSSALWIALGIGAVALFGGILLAHKGK